MIVYRSNIYLTDNDIQELKEEPEYVKKRYEVIARTLAPKPFGITREKAAEMIGLCLRQLYRVVSRFRKEGIGGLRFKSKKPQNSPTKTPEEIEKKVLEIREATGFGSGSVSSVLNEISRINGDDIKMYPSLAYNILVRNGEIERERRHQAKCRRFEWGKANDLIQADITKLNGIPILTLEDDHSRRGWAVAMPNELDDTVIDNMKELITCKFRNLLTDNGSQFSRLNEAMRKFCEKYLSGKHIWTSVHHPQTMGKLSRYQKDLKRFLRHRMGTSNDRDVMNHWIDVFNHWYNHGKYHSGGKGYPMEKYMGWRDESWVISLCKSLGLNNLISFTRDDICY